MIKEYLKTVQTVLLVCTVLLLAGCGSLANKNFPTLSGIKKVAQDAMTPEQQVDYCSELEKAIAVAVAGGAAGLSAAQVGGIFAAILGAAIIVTDDSDS